MYKKLRALVFFNFLMHPFMYGVTEIASGKMHDYWMIWNTSKEYTVRPYSKDEFLMQKNNYVQANISCSEVNELVIYCTMPYTITFHTELENEENLVHSIGQCFLREKQHWIKKIIKIPELNRKLDKDCLLCLGYDTYTHKKGSEIIIVMKNKKKDNEAVHIIPKKIPEKNLLTFNNLQDITLDYLYLKNVF